MDIFTPPKAPQITNTKIDEKPRLITNDFGDGYTQDVVDGVNPTKCQFTASWATLTLAQRDMIRNFFVAHIGKTFFYTLPDEVTPRKWKALSWTRSFQSGAVYSLDATLEERFDLT